MAETEARAVADLLLRGIAASQLDGKPLAVLLTLSTSGHCHAALRAWEDIAALHPTTFRLLWIENTIRDAVANQLKHAATGSAADKRVAGSIGTAFTTTAFPKLLRWMPGTTKPSIHMGFSNTSEMCKFIAGHLPMPPHAHAK